MSNVISRFEKFKIRLLGAPENRREFCWLWHDWSRWSPPRPIPIYATNESRRPYTIEQRQQRTCKRCGKTQFRVEIT